LPALDQAAAAQPVQGLQHLHRSTWCAEDGQQLLQAHRLEQDCEPGEHTLLERREAVKLLAQQFPHTPKDGLALLQEWDNLAPEELHDGLCYDLYGQWVAPVHLAQAVARVLARPRRALVVPSSWRLMLLGVRFFPAIADRLLGSEQGQARIHTGG